MLTRFQDFLGTGNIALNKYTKPAILRNVYSGWIGMGRYTMNNISEMYNVLSVGRRIGNLGAKLGVGREGGCNFK